MDVILSAESLKLLRPILILHEGYKTTPYYDQFKNLTVGIGHNLGAHPIEDDVVNKWFIQDTTYFYNKLCSQFSWYKKLSLLRQVILIDMAFMGWHSFLGFTKMLQALSVQDYETAAQEVLNSEYAKQVGKRADDIAYILINDRISQSMMNEMFSI